MIYNDQLNLSNYYGELKIKSKVTAVDKNIDIGDFHFEFLHLPGHTIGSCFIILKNYHVIFSGDVLFKMELVDLIFQHHLQQTQEIV